ncbi:hypothetical protein ACJX0J_009170, partial [Zea mays]
KLLLYFYSVNNFFIVAKINSDFRINFNFLKNRKNHGSKKTILVSCSVFGLLNVAVFEL